MTPANEFQTLDLADWEGARPLAHWLVDDAITRLQGLRYGPIWQPMPEIVRDAFSEPVRTEISTLVTVYANVATKLNRYAMDMDLLLDNLLLIGGHLATTP